MREEKRIRTGAALPEDGRVRADLDDRVARDRAYASKGMVFSETYHL